MTSAATAIEPKAKNWLPTRYCDAMTKLVESDLVDVFEALGDVASRPCTHDQLLELGWKLVHPGGHSCGRQTPHGGLR